VSFELVIFDLDGTLVDSSRDLTNAANAALRELGLPEHSEAAVVAMIGDGARQLVERALPPEALHRTDEALALFRSHYAARLTEHTRPYDGVEELLAALEQPLAIATNKPGAFTRRLVEALAWSRRFAHVLGGDEVARPKPDPMMLLQICARARVRPEHALLVGDGPQDVGAARAAGVRVCSVTWGFTSESTLRDLAPDWVAARPADVLAIMRRA
jgi:phosphoglycolate phosphatase